MAILDTYYRAFKAYRKETAEDSGCEKDRRAVAEQGVEADRLKSTKYLCKIEEDWIARIEEGLTFVEKAVAEERQFIRTNGEVVPIEKVKKVSKDSVEHLAKHSDLITRKPENEEDGIVPDKLYMVEKLSDYAVYENRFLYMMLCYLKSFIDFRLEKIEDLRRKYVGDMAISKEIVSKKRTLKIKTEIYEDRTDNPYPVPDESSARAVQRIRDCQSIVNSLLGTDLMEQVSKSPMIKPPIVKTNVLKMDNNFKNALALYDYVASYKGQGFDYEEVCIDYAPFSEELADEISEAANLMSFVAYKAGNDIESLLAAEYEAEEARRREEESKKLQEKIKRLKKRALESNKTMEEYMLLLEERNRELEKSAEELIELRKTVEKLTAEIEVITREKDELVRRCGALSEELEEKEKEIAILNNRLIEDLAAARMEKEREVESLQAGHAEEMENIKSEYAAKLAETVEGYERQVENLNLSIEELNGQIAAAAAELDEKSAYLDERISSLDSDRQKILDECEVKIKSAEEGFERDVKKLEKEHAEELEKAREENALIRGELDGIRAKEGKLTPSADYTSRERFIELEEEYLAYHKFFKQQWEFTKKEIRKTVLWTKQEKANKKKKA